MSSTLAHTVIAVALIAAYVAVTLAGHDGNTVLAIAGGYVGGAATQAVASKPAPPL